MDKFDRQGVEHMLKAAKANGRTEEEVLLENAVLYHRKKEWLAVLEERSKSSGYRRNGKNLVDLLEEVCSSEDKRSLRDTVYGILFGDNDFLKYLDLESKVIYPLRKCSSGLYAILAAEDVYFSGYDEKVHSLSGFVSTRGNRVNDIQIYQNKMVDSGRYGLVETRRKKSLISIEDLNKMDCTAITSLAVEQEQFFGLVEYNNKRHGFVELRIEKGKLFLGRELIHYDTDHTVICQAVTIPVGEIGGYPFSILSCAYLSYLDLNGEKISGTQADTGQHINRLKVLRQDDEVLEVVYSGSKLNQITTAKIDIRKREVIAKSMLVKGLSDHVYALELVRDPELHQRLVNGDLSPKRKKILGLF